MKDKHPKLTPATALLNEICATNPAPRMLTEYEIELLRQSKKEIGEAVRKRFKEKKTTMTDPDQSYFHTREWQEGETEADRDIATGNTLGPFGNVDEAISALKGTSMDESKDVEALEKKLQEAETAVQEIFKAGKIPTPEDYAGVDRVKAALKVARRVKAMDAKRVDPKLTRKVTILLPEDEFQTLTKKATEEGVDLSKHIRMLLKNRS